MSNKRFKTSYPGVFYRVRNRIGGPGTEKVYYAVFKRDGKVVEAIVGRQYRDNMTPAKASIKRGELIEGRDTTRAEKRIEAQKKVWTVDNLKEEYFSHRPLNKSSKVDQGRYTKYLQPAFGKKKPTEIDQLSVDRVRVKLLKEKSPQTVKHVLALLSRIIHFGSDRGLCAGITFKIKKPKVDNVTTEDLSAEQLHRLVEVLNKSPLVTASNMMKLALFTGMRRGEIFKLKWEDIDCDRGFINIVAPKGGVTQKIPMNKNTQELFDSIKQVSEYVFPGRTGGPRKDANKDFNAIKKEAGLPNDFRPMHGLRHLYATMIASSGQVDMLTLQKLLTHKDQRMTQRYIHYREEALKRAGDTVDDILADVLQPQETRKTGSGK